jgi:hypothetical protein
MNGVGWVSMLNKEASYVCITLLLIGYNCDKLGYIPNIIVILICE